MKTLTATNARKNLGEWLFRAIKGEDIGIVHSASGKIVALRPVEVYSDDYAFAEYGLNDQEIRRFEKKVTEETRRARKAGKLKEWRP